MPPYVASCSEEYYEQNDGFGVYISLGILSIVDTCLAFWVT